MPFSSLATIGHDWTRFSRRLCLLSFFAYSLLVSLSIFAADLDAGPLFDEFDLTLTPGHRTEAIGPFFYSEENDNHRTWAIPPLFSRTIDPGTDSEEYDFCYPFLTWDRYGGQYRWALGQVFNFSGGATQKETDRDRFTLFPFYFQQRSSIPTNNYTALFPFYGHLQNRLFRDHIFFIMFPCFSRTYKRDVITDNYMYPFFHVRHGEALKGWQFLPIYGEEHKDITTRTNGFGELETIAGHDKRFILWPLWFEQHTGIGTTNPVSIHTSLPAFHRERSTNRDITTVIWPFFSKIEDREKKYTEWQMPWPLIIKARGSGKTTTRYFPFYSHAQMTNLESGFVMWPIYKYNHVHSDPLDRKRTRILLFLYSDTVARNTETGAFQRRADFWPLFTHHWDFNGNRRLQILAPVEPMFPNHKSIERNYAHLWSLWRAEENPRSGTSSQSLLWNLYRRETAPNSKRVSMLFGLYHYEAGESGKRVRLFYIPFGKAPKSL